MKQDEQLFAELIYIFHTAAMQALGKLKNPINGKFNKNLEQVKHSIDMLNMLKEKTTNNLSPELYRMLESFITEIKLNYVEEVNKN